LYASLEIAKLVKLPAVQEQLLPLRQRVLYGVKEELLPLVALKGIGRVRARNLYKAGYKGPKEIREGDVALLEKVPSIGRKIAEDIKKQLSAEAAA
jgi:helicase